MTPSEIEQLFTGSSGDYRFARWAHPIAPVVFGVEDATLAVVKGAFEAVVSLAGHRMAERDPELGANCMVFFLRDWSELATVPELDRLLPGIAALAGRLAEEGAERYRVFRFDDAGAIRAAFVFLRMGGDLAEMPAEDLALSEVVQAILCWSEAAFAEVSPLAIAGGRTILRPEIAEVIRAAYDPVLPDAARDPSHALRLAARMAR
ncbi:hypothetical protein [Seohaeicola zhoushanensis]|uniref:Uncharacterized protein n=1 Tax=Seohaeicola zhoushanensis TaxID=1569283 RepID=A0A8J3M8F0_9RHOB|nr:hypothetical protein [Seohaeicola zhoushanensis]GHF41930.1 hypothetical protein GCM10017056_12000 [Seohaeicola zhoushanensis]